MGIWVVSFGDISNRDVNKLECVLWYTSCNSVGCIFRSGVTVLRNRFQRKGSKLKFDTDLITARNEFHDCSTPKVAMSSGWGVFAKAQLQYCDARTNLKEIAQRSTRFLVSDGKEPWERISESLR